LQRRRLGLGHREEARREFAAGCLTNQVDRESFSA